MCNNVSHFPLDTATLLAYNICYILSTFMAIILEIA